ncbi:MAG: AmmeMemoRadiSam system protein B [Oceanospirillaceae bacterium]|nr:AmmeMemoRadiSam system protein B [Oceanospirillaceae bacterium]
MNQIRPAAVAGLFYPGQAASLRHMVDQLLSHNPVAESHTAPPRALVVPHAGLVYSGGTAARSYNLLSDAIQAGCHWRRILLLGPNHRVPLRGIAAPEADMFATPAGSMAIDRQAIEALEQNYDVQLRPDVHALEHCLEVQLPFLIKLLPSARLIPLVVGQESPERVADLVEWAWNQGDVLVVVSTDLSHYHAYDEACAIDAETDELIRTLSPRVLPEQACGAYALNGLLLAAQRRGLAVECLGRCNSGDTAGSRDQVVGYGSYAVF